MHLIDDDRPTQIWLTHVCHICSREIIRTFPRPSRAAACLRCVRLDHTLGRWQGAALLTPIDDGWASGTDVVHGRLGSADPGEALRRHHVSRMVAMITDGRRDTGLLLAVRYPGGQPHARVMHWDEWQHTYPSDARTTAEGYLAYVDAVHPWVRYLEPRVADVDWLTTLVTLM